MTGAGSGFSVERQFTDRLPTIPSHFHPSVRHIIVEDSREGWCYALDDLLRHLYSGSVPTWDISLLRPAGTRLNTFGGYASGGEVLDELFQHIVQIFKQAAGRRLRPIEVFSICTYIAQIVVVGGVRRSATIALFDKDDEEMLTAKSGEWWVDNPQFAMANISAVFEDDPTREDFDRFWGVLEHSGSGEPGIFNRKGVWQHLKRHGRAIHYSDGRLIPFLANPCCEIILRPRQACNLSGFAIRPDDNLAALENKTALATILGTLQATVNHFEYVSPEWHKNINEERLLGVCPSGFYDHEVLSKADGMSEYVLTNLRGVAQRVNKRFATDIGIPVSASVTSVKPAGNSGEMYNTASGIHPRRSKYFIRRIRVAKTDPVGPFLRDQGVPVEDSFQNPERDLVFSFPRKAPDGAITIDDVTAIQALNHWKHVKTHYTTHTVSATISVRDDEWDHAGDWVFSNFKHITGISFLPHDGGTYQQAPYETVSEFEYEKLAREMPVEIDWDLLKFYEQSDQTTASQELACIGDKCMLT
jgi:ribonucleoside-diphosphate reductase alpha chain